MGAKAGTFRMDNISAGEVGGVFAGIVALLATLGGAIRWSLGWKDRRDRLREEKLIKWEESLQRREKEQRERTEGRLEATEQKLSAVSMALFEVLGELQRIDPASPVIASATRVLREAYPIEPDIPAEMKALVRRLDHPKETT